MKKSSTITWKKSNKNKETERSTIDHGFVIKQLLEKANDNGQEVHFIFLDLGEKKKKDTVPFQKLWEALEDMKINKMIMVKKRISYF